MSQDKFEWTDTRILEFVGFLCGRGMEITQLENELRLFKEEKSKQSKEDRGWEIVEGCMVQYPENRLAKILSVRRLSDGEVFSIGDEVEWGHCRGAHKIEKILEERGFLKFKGTIPCSFSFVLQGLQKVTKLKPLFTTEDGVEIFDGEQLVYSVCCKAQWQESEFKANRLDKRGYEGDIIRSLSGSWKHFSTPEKREEFILIKKPLLSLEDVMGVYRSSAGEMLAYLKGLAKSKLNQK
jgi:hypothetical protein